MAANLTTLFLVSLIAVAAPVVSELPIRLRLPIVVVEIGLGIVVGPHVLAWGTATGVLAFLGALGLSFLFFLAGLELDFDQFRGKPIELAVKSWAVTIVLSLGLTLLLRAVGFLDAPISRHGPGRWRWAPCCPSRQPASSHRASARSNGPRRGQGLGRSWSSPFCSADHSAWLEILLLLALIAVNLLAAMRRCACGCSHHPAAGANAASTSQLPVRICILLMVGLVALARKFGLDVMLGTFGAGMVVRLASTGEKGEVLREKLEAIGYGFLVPLFFVVSGMKFDLEALLASTDAMLRVPLFLALFLLLRGGPSLFFYRRELGKGERLPFLLYISTALPLVVAITDIGVATGRMRGDNAAALVGAGMLSLLLFPLLALVLRKRTGAARPGRIEGVGEDAL
jgi:Kef-type K+ transport system membrane component KefB